MAQDVGPNKNPTMPFIICRSSCDYMLTVHGFRLTDSTPEPRGPQRFLAGIQANVLAETVNN
jgi:hypothetical protein